MNCKDCGIEHPSEHIANPHYCIARLQERVEEAETVIAAFVRACVMGESDFAFMLLEGYKARHPKAAGL